MPDESAEFSGWTLGDFVSSPVKLMLEGQCAEGGCGAFSWFDVRALIDKYGADFQIPLVLPWARCSKCGGALRLMISMPPDPPDNDAQTDGQ